MFYIKLIGFLLTLLLANKISVHSSTNIQFQPEDRFLGIAHNGSVVFSLTGNVLLRLPLCLSKAPWYLLAGIKYEFGNFSLTGWTDIKKDWDYTVNSANNIYRIARQISKDLYSCVKMPSTKTPSITDSSTVVPPVETPTVEPPNAIPLETTSAPVEMTTAKPLETNLAPTPSKPLLTTLGPLETTTVKPL